MTRTTRRAAVAILLGGLGAAGCHGTGGGAGKGGQPEGWTRYYNAVDPCYPERYNAQARASVLVPFAAQVNNGHVLEQTVWNWHFDTSSDTLNPAGQAKLDAIAQKRPHPDGKVYLQVARDIPAYGAGGLETVAARRDDLTAKRAETIRKYMAAQPALQPVTYEVHVIDAPVPGMPAEFSARAYRGQATGYVGGLQSGGAGVTSTGSGGAAATTSGPTSGGNQGGPSGPGGGGTGPGTGGPTN
ncbi:MAG TPA: hypothetical protein VD866_21310 [Urbifossiella sp.]|nr:hypothetical protein [Urbifossiella sp.]